MKMRKRRRKKRRKRRRKKRRRRRRRRRRRNNFLRSLLLHLVFICMPVISHRQRLFDGLNLLQ
jgi:hypothetical protein